MAVSCIALLQASARPLVEQNNSHRKEALRMAQHLSTTQKKTMKNVRVRFAPSPTGKLHIGGVRTLLYNVFFAKHHQGTLLLRIEDTDPKRFDPTSEAYINQVLEWLQITPDESPKQGGPFGPYRQSERKAIYQKYALELVAKGQAYYAFDSVEKLEIMRARERVRGVAAPKYNAITRMSMENSFTLSKEEVARRLQAKVPYVVRLHVDYNAKIKFEDTIRGWIQVKGSTLDDKILLKEDGMPTYHLANVVDDYLMQITHVIRGEEWLPSTPLHVLLYQAFGWRMPIFAHLPLLLRSNGQGKLSKRMAAKDNTLIFPIAWKDEAQSIGFPGFREAGYLREAFMNFVALLGWHPGSHEELFSYQDLCSKFSLRNINKAGVRVDLAKARWFNQQYIKRLPEDVLAEKYILPTLPKTHQQVSLAYLKKVCKLVKNRLAFPQDLWAHQAYLFTPPTDYPNQVLAKKWNPNTKALLQEIIDHLEKLAHWDARQVQTTIQARIQQSVSKPSEIMPLIRIAVTGTTKGPGLPQIIELLGQKEVIQRLQHALSMFSDHTTAQ